MAPDKLLGVIGKLVDAAAKRDSLAALKARFGHRGSHEIERSLAIPGLTCSNYNQSNRTI